MVALPVLTVRSVRRLALLLGRTTRLVPSVKVTLEKYTMPPTPATTPRSDCRPTTELPGNDIPSVIWFTSGWLPVVASSTIPPTAPPFWNVVLDMKPAVSPTVIELYVPPVRAPSSCSMESGSVRTGDRN